MAASPFPVNVEEIFEDYQRRRGGLLRALTDDLEELYQQADPERDNLCLYGTRDGAWAVELPAEEVPPELPEPCLGINFARDGMQKRDWVALVAVHSDSWLLAVAFFYAVKLDAAGRLRLFKLINTMPTLFESVSQRNKYKTSAPPQAQPGGPGGPVVKKKKFEDRPTESKFPSGRLLKADDVSPALKGRQAELFWPDNQLWYLVEIINVNAKTKQAKIVYASGEEEDLDLAEIVFGGLEVPEGCNDGACLLAALAGGALSVPQVLSALRGPWALLYWDALGERLWLGRDVLGRRSLLMHLPDPNDPRFLLSSVSQLPPTAAATVSGPAPPAAAAATAGGRAAPVAAAAAPTSELVAGGGRGGGGGAGGAAAVRVRCCCVEARSPHPAAAYTAAFVAAAAAAVTAGASSPGPGSDSGPARAHPPWPSWSSDRPLDFHTGPGGTQPAPDQTGRAPAVDLGADPRAALGRHSAVGGGASAAAAAPVMILFSGGVDSVLLAALAHRALPLETPIDLSNVCFGGAASPSPDREAARSALEELAAACPGRRWRLIEVDACLEDLDRHRSRLLALLRPAGTVMDLNIGAALWLAVAGQGTLRLPAAAAAVAATAPHLPDPHTAATPAHVAALSNGAPAAGVNKNPGGNISSHLGPVSPVSEQPPPGAPPPPPLLPGSPFGSAARVVLLGHGADEQCGGYGRHRTRFRSCGPAGLSSELEVDVRRLWVRNLGRDDRLVADWGREARHPFLDEGVMGLLLRMRLEHIADLELPPGRGDKQLLRSALCELGLPQAAARVKRAIQFGSRIGKLANRRDFGSNRAANRKHAGGVALQDVASAAGAAAAGAWSKPPRPGC
ncbi:PHD finger protein ALFIN-LIKE 1 [Tetrabaena socialis]|uniref:PHD finger protein ALFIN-LIKE 1 n=1 Tax=Tetrabaena socialis TaxID=47790 RepID=A0A2J7ZQK3_9CHLO|nr:PHD finger protein ALFIN-LIKE 1 [Tetrabaena socialis]|eukprot:PNH02542.1 PHD finger protein ALFIN-LIKE 1 [Tetrabaena socialis]